VFCLCPIAKILRSSDSLRMTARFGLGHFLFWPFAAQLEPLLDRPSNRLSERNTERNTDRISDRISNRISHRNSRRISHRISDRVLGRNSNRNLNRISDRNSKRISYRISNRLSHRNSDRISDRNSDRIRERPPPRPLGILLRHLRDLPCRILPFPAACSCPRRLPKTGRQPHAPDSHKIGSSCPTSASLHSGICNTRSAMALPTARGCQL
jgi:hypothetical protein